VLNSFLFGVIAYLIGSVSFAVVVSRVFKLADPRSYGSKNPGATNVLRSGNKAAAALTLLGDALKGTFAVLLAQYFGPRYGVGDFGMALVVVGVFLGHLYPVFFRFVGGKGVATALGILTALDLWLGLGTLAVWLVVVFATRYSSLGAIVAALAAPLIHMLAFVPDVVTIAIALMSVLLIWRHNENIGRLLGGTESKIGAKKDGAKKAR
jgi:acyl phosphate:glycerol-3-phosphate acyltransferase